LCNVRRLGVTSIDFESGADVIPFDCLDDISPARATTIGRNTRECHPAGGQPLLMARHLCSGGFVPLGARLKDGRPHPHAGTGFIVGTTVAFAADFSTRLHRDLPGPFSRMELHQTLWDGGAFHVTRSDYFIGERILPGWNVVGRGLGGAIPDGEDLLHGLTVREGNGSTQSGLARWRRGPEGWRPVSFTPVTPSEGFGEPSVQRDVDGRLLFAARGALHVSTDGESYGIAIWRSGDGGVSWEAVVSAPGTRGNTPTILNQAADGTPYVAGNPYTPGACDGTGRRISIWSHRQKVALWPLRADRRALLPPVLARDTADFGPPPEGRVWYADHPLGATVQLADGRWRHLLAWRVRESQPARDSCERPTPFTGTFIEEVSTPGAGRPPWGL